MVLLDSPKPQYHCYCQLFPIPPPHTHTHTLTEQSHSEQFAKLVSEVRGAAGGRGRRKEVWLNGSHDPITEATPTTGSRSESRTTTTTAMVHMEASCDPLSRGGQGQGSTARGRKGQSPEADRRGGQDSDAGDWEGQSSDEDIMILAADSLDAFSDPVRSKVEVRVQEDDTLDLTIPERYAMYVIQSTCPLFKSAFNSVFMCTFLYIMLLYSLMTLYQYSDFAFSPPTPSLSPPLLRANSSLSPSTLSPTTAVQEAMPKATPTLSRSVLRVSCRNRRQLIPDLSSSSPISCSPLATTPKREVGMSHQGPTPSRGEVKGRPGRERDSTPYRSRKRLGHQ